MRVASLSYRTTKDIENADILAGTGPRAKLRVQRFRLPAGQFRHRLHTEEIEVADHCRTNTFQFPECSGDGAHRNNVQCVTRKTTAFLLRGDFPCVP